MDFTVGKRGGAQLRIQEKVGIDNQETGQRVSGWKIAKRKD